MNAVVDFHENTVVNRNKVAVVNHLKNILNDEKIVRVDNKKIKVINVNIDFSFRVVVEEKVF